MKRQPHNKLSISGETLRHLRAAEVANAAGGKPPPWTHTDLCVSTYCPGETERCPSLVCVV